MTKYLKIIAHILISISIISCSSKNKEKKIDLYGDLSDLPSWILSPKSQDGVTAVGISNPSKGGIQFQINKAELDGKANIAAIIQSKISRLTKNSLWAAKVNNNEDVDDFFAQATKEIIKDLPLSGVKRIKTYRAKDGVLYVQMLLSNKDYTSFIKNGQKTFDSMLRTSDIATSNIDKTQKASEILFKELENQ